MMSDQLTVPDEVYYGQVIAVRGPVIDAHFAGGTPSLGARLRCHSPTDGDVMAFVHSHLGQSTVRAIAVDSTRGLRRGGVISCDGQPLTVPVSNALLGRVIDLRGRPLDSAAELNLPEALPLHHTPPPPSERQLSGDIYPTGIKIIDLFCPFTYGGRVAVFGGAGVGKTIVLTEFIHNAVNRLGNGTGIASHTCKRHEACCCGGPTSILHDRGN